MGILVRFRRPAALIACAALCFSTAIISENAAAECVPSEDTCAPKKKVGEWDSSALIGFNLTQGNSETTLLTLGLKAALDKDGNVIDLAADYGYGEDKALDSEENGDTSRNDFRAAARYDRILGERFYVGFGAKFLYDEIADVDYRVNMDPNVGYYLLRDNSFKLRLEGGPSYVFEKVGGEEDDYFAPRLGDRFEWAITCTSKIYQQAEVLFDASDSDNYLVNAEVGIEAAIATNLALAFIIRETFDNQPAAGREKDDLAIISSLKVSL
jgi:putative salt-induced outer membrane protein YdiY